MTAINRFSPQRLKENYYVNRYLRKILFIIIISALILAIVQTAAATGETFITTAGVNLRSAASTDSNIVTTIPSGSSVTLISHDPAGWSRVRINGSEGFVRSEFLTFPSSRAPLTFTTTAGVNLRASASTNAEILRTINIGIDVEVNTHDPAGWSRVRINGSEGFVSSEFLMRSVNAGAAAQTASTPAAVQSVVTIQSSSGVNFRTAPSTDATIIRVLDSGTSVEVLGTAANASDWSSVRVNGTTGYIRTDVLTAGPRNVELLTMDQVRSLIPINQDITLTDVRTGRQFNIRAFSLGRHADVETSTQRDTDIKFDIRGGTWSWAARPVWVHLGGRTIAASINGMPHDVDFIAGNGMNGHLCLHFHGTITNNQRYQADLRNAIAEAYAAGQR